MNKFNIEFWLMVLVCGEIIVYSLGADDYYYEACVPRNCGDGRNISYPFYIRDLQEPFCGVPDFELTCDQGHGYPLLHTPGNDFIVGEINYRNNSARLKNAAVENSSCAALPGLLQNVMLDDIKYELFDSVSPKLVLLSNCSNISSQIPWDFDRINQCSGSGGGGYYMAMLENDTNLLAGIAACDGEVVIVPVDLEQAGGGSVVGGWDLEEVVKRGFLIKFVALNCTDCYDSGGRCGFDEKNTRFQCYCPDRPHSWSCVPEDAKYKDLLKRLIAALLLGALLLVLLLVLYFGRRIVLAKSMFIRRNKRQRYLNVETFLKNHRFLATQRYSYQEIKKMTDSFKVKLGQGGYGCVYKGKLRNGDFVAVKIFNESEGNGEDFINEVASVGTTSHVNVVSLLGFCFEGDKNAVIYEFMPNGSLEKFICDRGTMNANNTRLGWEKLYQIAIGIARGLEYLHRGCNTRILHFDIKPHNILLDQDFCPKISDFGLAKLFSKKESVVSMSRMRGTPGYIAPEVLSRTFGEVSHKSDVYSYGMMVLEIVGVRRRKNIEVGAEDTSELYFPQWVYKRVELDEDLGLQGISNDEENKMARNMVIVGLWCIQPDPSNRPSIKSALEMLEGNLEPLKIPPKPLFHIPSHSPQSLVIDFSTNESS